MSGRWVVDRRAASVQSGVQVGETRKPSPEPCWRPGFLIPGVSTHQWLGSHRARRAPGRHKAATFARRPRVSAASLPTEAGRVDLRPRIAFAAAHVSGTVNIEYGQSFTSYAGSVLPWPGPLVLLAASPDIVAATQRDLSRIGMDQVVGQVLSRWRGW